MNSSFLKHLSIYWAWLFHYWNTWSSSTCWSVSSCFLSSDYRWSRTHQIEKQCWKSKK